MKNYAIIASGGNGTRLGKEGGKQLIKLGGIPMMIRAIIPFQESPLIDEIIVVANQNDISGCRKLVGTYKLNKVTTIVSSGASRQDSVLNGLTQVSEARYILIHDGARPFVNGKIIIDIIEALETNDGAIPVLPVTDTIKIVNSSGFVERTTDRSRMVAVQTPQGFRYDILKKAYENLSNNAATDDSTLVELVGGRIKTVSGSIINIKITYKTDLHVAQIILKEQSLCA